MHRIQQIMALSHINQCMKYICNYTLSDLTSNMQEARYVPPRLPLMKWVLMRGFPVAFLTEPCRIRTPNACVVSSHTLVTTFGAILPTCLD